MYLAKEEIIKRSILYAVSIVVLTGLVLFLMLSSQSFINQFINYQSQIIVVAAMVLTLALFIQLRQTSESTSNAQLHHQLEQAHTDLEQSNRFISQKQQEVERDLHTALRVQQALINRYQPTPGVLNVASRSIPAANLGGDFYEFIQSPTDLNRCDIVIGDVAGHGIPSALIAVLSMVLMAQLTREDRSPAILLLKSNVQIEEYLRETTVPFVTAFWATMDLERRQLSYAKAGHPPALWCRNGVWSELGGKGVFLGSFSNSVYEEDSIQLESGDLLVFYTDGITESRSTDGELYGEERLQHVLASTEDRSPQGLVDAVFRDVDLFSAGKQTDDRTLIVLAV